MKIRGKTCPVCGMEVHGEVESRGRSKNPREGDIGVCMHCGVVMTYVVVGDKLEREVMSQEAWDAAQESVDARSIERVQHFVRRRKNVSSIQS